MFHGKGYDGLTTAWRATENLPKESGHQNLTERRSPSGTNKRSEEDNDELLVRTV